MNRKTGSIGGWEEAKAEGEMNQPLSVSKMPKSEDELRHSDV